MLSGIRNVDSVLHYVDCGSVGILNISFVNKRALLCHVSIVIMVMETFIRPWQTLAELNSGAGTGDQGKWGYFFTQRPFWSRFAFIV